MSTPGAREMTASSIQGVCANVARARGVPRPSCTCAWSQPGLNVGMASKSSIWTGPPVPARNAEGREDRVETMRWQDSPYACACPAVPGGAATSGYANSRDHRRRIEKSETNRTDGQTDVRDSTIVRRNRRLSIGSRSPCLAETPPRSPQASSRRRHSTVGLRSPFRERSSLRHAVAGISSGVQGFHRQRPNGLETTA